ncbi:hypothetical protein LTR36_007527 [Oleoguttula mirabilis]|uniref:Ubiquitin carboxyl-terminal hydrolase n=1 Tax=Oleoguttula mirabilis TaxID=1507867 RepID=A0AAV9JUD0_9PEZI|nr:hypothetical protein LTR36_007527 [Oleoguttula mirabilis]
MATTTLTPTSATEAPKLIKKATEAKNPTTPTQTSYGCSHIKSLLQAARQQATDGYSRIIQALQKDGNVSGRTYKSGAIVETSAHATYLCLQCPNVSSSRERHRKDHAFSIEACAGFLYCHDCRDFVYDPTFEEIRSGTSTKKRKHSALQPEDRRTVASNTATTPCAATGLRGLYNMGQTCFMSVVLQSLIHNPLIRTYYLSEGHKSTDCEREACTSCALDDLFYDFFAQEKHEGYGAVHMLQGCWKGGGGLAGYSQQDAHEYLGFILNSLHTANIADDEDEEGKKRGDAKDCECVVHQTFGGLLRSTVTCMKCKNVTSTSDPFMDLSLDIKSAPVVVKKKKLPLTNGTTTVKEVLPMDLTECLDRYTSVETLSADDYRCRKCDGGQEAKKRLSLNRLPPVVPVHLKRFSHSKSLKESSKVDTKVRFPLTLDLAPYVSAPSKKQMAKQSLTNGLHKPTAGDEEGTDKFAGDHDYGLSEPVYDLSSVVVHKGKIDNGHYISYAKQSHEWFRFDDSMVVQVEEREVLGAEAYMLFYVARGFDI